MTLLEIMQQDLIIMDSGLTRKITLLDLLRAQMYALKETKQVCLLITQLIQLEDTASEFSTK
jgi:hypothetical protein